MSAIPQWDVEVKEMPQPGDKVTLCGVDLIFGNWEPSENYTTQYNVQIGRTVGECASNLVAAINCADNRYGGYHLNRMITPVFAMQYGRFAHLTVRDLTSNGSGISLSVSAEGRLAVYEQGEPDSSAEQTSASGTEPVEKVALTIKANNVDWFEGSPRPTFSCTGTGFTNGDTLDSLSGTLVYKFYKYNTDTEYEVGDSIPPEADTKVNGVGAQGKLTIRVSGLTSDKYDISFQDGTLALFYI